MLLVENNYPNVIDYVRRGEYYIITCSGCDYTGLVIVRKQAKTRLRRMLTGHRCITRG
jgi:predicted nucleic-acid-binding Zn-ribbon protein